MQRYFIPISDFTESEVRIAGEDARHLSAVLRARPGDRVICSDGERLEAEVEITQVDKQEVRARIVRTLDMTAEPAIRLWVAQSLPKGDKLETVIQKCTEIGAARFVPFISERTVVQYDERKESKRLERWRKIAKEAAEQAHRNRIPQVDAPIAWKQLLALAAQADVSLICYEKDGGLSIRSRLSQLGKGRTEWTAMLIVGPEGGFAEREIAEAEDAGCCPVSLGPRILRTETAAMVALTCFLYEFGEMGG